MKTHTYKVLLKKEPEYGFTVLISALEGFITYGETLEEAQKNAKEAVELYLESLEENNIPFPIETQLLEYNLQIAHG